MKIILASLLIILTPLYAQEIVNKTIDTQVEASNVSIELQNKIDELDVESKKIYFEYKDTLNEYKSLKNYDDQLSQIIDAQIEEIASIKDQLDSLDSINIDILPLLKRMVDSLSKFISLDIPFLIDERTQRVIDLDSLILRADITTAEKFRKIFEAYQIEAKFGKTIEVYQGFLQIDDNEKAVDFFRLGRLGLFYRTPNGSETGYWNSINKNWVNAGSSLDDEIKAALNIGNRQAPPNFISLPIKPIAK
jgi:DNA repair exonuclease SbcCD ATPase subunit